MNNLEWVKKFWSSKTSPQKTNIIIVTAVFVATCALIFSWASRPDYKPLFTNVSSKDASSISKKLQEEKIPYKLEDEGNTILVPQRYLYETRLKLAGSGLPESGTVGFELFDKMNIQTSEFVENINYVRALQGELSRTILSIQEVKAARVMLNLPRESIYMEESTLPTASVVLSMGSNKGLSQEQIQSIAYLVASSVKNLKPENVTIVDEKGSLLYAPEMAGAGFSSSTHFQMQKNKERDLETKVQTAMDRIFGAGKSLIKVNVEMEFDKQTIEKDTYEPVDKNLGILRSAQENSETYVEGASATPSPRPTASPAAAGGGTAATSAGLYGTASTKPVYDQKNMVRNYELNKSHEQRVVAPGKIKRLSCGVFLDKAIALDEAGKKNIYEVLESSIGIDKTRGDIIKIHSFAFNTDYWDQQKKAMADDEKRSSIYRILRLGSPAVAVLIFIIFYLLMLKRLPKGGSLAPVQAGKAPQAMLKDGQTGPIARLAGPPADSTIYFGASGDNAAKPDADSLKKMAAENPQRLAGVIEALLKEGE